MKIEALTTFPEMFDTIMSCSMMRIAREKGLLDFAAYNLRDWTHDRHKTTDDDPFGGGHGLIMKCEPIFEAYDDLCSEGPHPYTILLSPAGKTFTEDDAIALSEQERLLFICGHYEGVDERVYSLADETYSIGDYVLTGAELPSLVIIDATVRRIPGVLGDERGPIEESFTGNLLEYPQYTRPSSYRGMDVPEVLLSGNHAAIARWRHEQSLERTAKLRPDLLTHADLCAADLDFVQRILHE